MLGILAVLFSLAACGERRAPAMSLPDADDIVRIELEMCDARDPHEAVEYTGPYDQFLGSLTKESKPSFRQSVDDQPVGVEEYCIIRFHQKGTGNSPSVVYIYADGRGRKWIEQPYVGIWSLSEEAYARVLLLFR